MLHQSAAHVVAHPDIDASRARGMTVRPVPRRYWRGYGTDPLPTPAEALAEPFNAFPSWFMRITCDRCGKRPPDQAVAADIVARNGATPPLDYSQL